MILKISEQRKLDYSGRMEHCLYGLVNQTSFVTFDPTTHSISSDAIQLVILNKP